MRNYLKFYLTIIPIISIIGLIVGAISSAYPNIRVIRESFLILGIVLDFFILIAGRKHFTNKITVVVVVFLIISLIVGLLNFNDISRRYITDFTNPFFFFAKIFIFKEYWLRSDFNKYLSYYVKISFWSSLALLPVVYFIFGITGATRMAMFPPMELPFSFFMQSGQIFFFISLLVILFYGKRAQLVGALLTFITFTFIYKRKHFLKNALLIILVILSLNYILITYSDNYAINRLMYTFKIAEDNAEDNIINSIAGSRAVEVELILKEMNSPLDYFFGKGLGFEYRFIFNETDKMHANAHFSPVGLMSKYGIIFTIFLYIYLLKVILKVRKNKIDKAYISAFGACFFVFIESFFSYALFVTPILPVAFGYLLFRQSEK